MRILIHRTRGYGDVFWTEPLISDLVAAGHVVALKTTTPDLVENVPGLALNPTSFPADATVDLDWSYEANPQCHILEAYYGVCREIIPCPKLRYPRLYLGPGESANPPLELQRPFAVFHLKYAHYRKNYRKIHNIDWPEVLDHVRNKIGLNVVRLADQLPLPGFVPRTARLREAIPWIRSCAVFVGVDSAPSHIAAALGVPALIFFGAINPSYRHLPDFYGLILQNPCQFAGCYHTDRRRSHADRPPSCALVGDGGNPPCCRFTTKQVIATIDKLVGT